jgi:SSS family solute:Na+ symporter
VAIDFMQRIFGAKSPEVARRACFLGAAGTFVIGTIFALVALTASSVLGLTADNGPVLYQLLGDHAPPLLAILVLSGIVAASFSTASGAILATSAVAVRNVFQVRRMSTDAADPLLRYTRIAMVPIVVIGVVIAIRVSETGILLTLAFDLMLACLAAPFLLGVYWKRPGVDAALTAIVAGLVVRVTFLVLTPTLYGVDNDLFYLPNSVFGAGFDGWATLISAVVGFGSYVLVGVLRARPVAEHEWERSELAELHREASVEIAEPAAV